MQRCQLHFVRCVFRFVVVTVAALNVWFSCGPESDSVTHSLSLSLSLSLLLPFPLSVSAQLVSAPQYGLNFTYGGLCVFNGGPPAVSSTNDIYVACGKSNTVMKWTNGSLTGTVFTTCVYPAAVAISSLDDIYVICNDQVYMWTKNSAPNSNGTLISNAYNNQQFYFSCLAADSSGNIYACYSDSNNPVIRFSNSGTMNVSLTPPPASTCRSNYIAVSPSPYGDVYAICVAENTIMRWRAASTTGYVLNGTCSAAAHISISVNNTVLVPCVNNNYLVNWTNGGDDNGGIANIFNPGSDGANCLPIWTSYQADDGSIYFSCQYIVRYNSGTFATLPGPAMSPAYFAMTAAGQLVAIGSGTVVVYSNPADVSPTAQVKLGTCYSLSGLAVASDDSVYSYCPSANQIIGWTAPLFEVVSLPCLNPSFADSLAVDLLSGSLYGNCEAAVSGGIAFSLIRWEEGSITSGNSGQTLNGTCFAYSVVIFNGTVYAYCTSHVLMMWSEQLNFAPTVLSTTLPNFNLLTNYVALSVAGNGDIFIANNAKNSSQKILKWSNGASGVSAAGSVMLMNGTQNICQTIVQVVVSSTIPERVVALCSSPSYNLLVWANGEIPLSNPEIISCSDNTPKSVAILNDTVFANCGNRLTALAPFSGNGNGIATTQVKSTCQLGPLAVNPSSNSVFTSCATGYLVKFTVQPSLPTTTTTPPPSATNSAASVSISLRIKSLNIIVLTGFVLVVTANI